MKSKKRAQILYNKLLNERPNTLNELLFNLSANYSEDKILNLNDWVNSYGEAGNLFVLIRIAQESEDLDIEDRYVRTSMYYYGVKSSDDIIDLVDENEAIEWITSALKSKELIADLDFNE